MRKINDFLVVGAGSIGQRHIQCLSDLGVANIYISEPHKDNHRLAQKRFDIKEAFSELDEALQRHYDGVLVAVPNHLHAEVACKVIEKKMDVVIEKPIEISLDSALKIQRAVEKNNVVCLIAYCFRFDPALS